MKTKLIINDLLSFIAGGLLVLAFYPFGFFWLAPFSIALLLRAWLKTSVLRATFRGFLFGLGLFGFGVSWIYISLHQFGHLNLFIASLLTLLFIVTLSLFTALQGFCFAKLFPHNNTSKLLIAFPSLWLLFEWIRDWIFTGFPWLYLGYSQTNSPLSSYAPIIGVYGTTFLVAFSAALINIFLDPNLIHPKKICKKVIRYLSLSSLIIIWMVGAILHTIHWTQPFGKPIQVSLVQGNIPQTIKWSPQQIFPTLKRYQNLTQQHVNSRLIVWPEAAVPVTLQYAITYLKTISDLAKQHHTTVILGIPNYAGNGKFYNAAVEIGKETGIYNKRHLVPFGEYVPLENLFSGIFRVLNAPQSEFISGAPRQRFLRINNILIAPYICYEIAYAELVRNDMPTANLIIVLSNDAWFGHSLAAAQHIQIGQMRSLETGRYTLFTTNNGITAVISPRGKILKKLPRFKTAVLTYKVSAMHGRTPWIILGILPIIFGAFILLLISIICQRRRL